MSGPDDELTSGEISRSFERVESAIKDVAAEMKSGFAEVNTRFDLMRGEFVHRTEWALYREATDKAIKEVKADLLEDIASTKRDAVKAVDEVKASAIKAVDDVKAEATSRRIPWTAVVGVILAGLALVAPFVAR